MTVTDARMRFASEATPMRDKVRASGSLLPICAAQYGEMRRAKRLAGDYALRLKKVIAAFVGQNQLGGDRLNLDRYESRGVPHVG